MKTRNMEEPDIPDGFEHFLLEESGGTFSYEHVENRNKELVLICAPAEFDINKLKGEQFILNGCKSLENSHSESEGTALKWEVHSSLATSDKHLNILLPSDLQRKHLISNPVSTTLNVVRDIHIPMNLKLPERKKKGTRLPKPIGLKTRWIPYGSESPGSFKKMNGPNGVFQHGEEIGSYGAHKKIKENTYKEKKSSKSQNNYCKPDSNLVEMMDKTNNIVDSNSKKKKKKKKELNMTGDNIYDSETNLTDPMDIDIRNVQVNIKSESKEFTGIVRERKQKKKKNSELSEEDEKDISAKVEDSVLGRASIIERSTSPTIIQSEDVYPVDHITEKHRKKKKKKYQDEEGKYQEPEDFNLDNCTLTGNEVKHKNIKEKDEENPCVSKKKKKKNNLLEENVEEDMKSNPVMYVNQTNMNKIKVAIDNEKEESLVDVSCKKHKKKKKKDGESQEKPVVSIDKKNDMALQDAMIYKQNNFHLIKIEEENALTVNEVQLKNVKENGDENPCASKRKKKERKSHENNDDEDMTYNPVIDVNQTNMNEVKVAIDNDKEESLVDVSCKKHKKKKKKDSESQEKPVDCISKKNETTLNDEMIYKENNFHQIKIKEENGLMEESCSIKNIKKKKRKRKRKSSLNEHNANDANTKSDDILSHSTHLVEVTKHGSLETNYLPEPHHANMEGNKKKSKKRKYEAVLTDHIEVKKQKLDTSNDSSFTKVKKKTNEGLLKTCDNDLDSDDEARIFGVVPK